MLMREFTFEGSNINLLVKGSPDYIWSHGLVKLKNRMYAEAAMDNKYRTGDHAESCIYHVLAQVYPKFAYAKRYTPYVCQLGSLQQYTNALLSCLAFA